VVGPEEEAAELMSNFMGIEHQPMVGYLSGVHHAPHSDIGVAASAVYYSGSGEKAPCCTDAAGLFSVVGRRRWLFLAFKSCRIVGAGHDTFSDST
jgi:hypothetical protein